MVLRVYHEHAEQHKVHVYPRSWLNMQANNKPLRSQIYSIYLRWVTSLFSYSFWQTVCILSLFQFAVYEATLPTGQSAYFSLTSRKDFQLLRIKKASVLYNRRRPDRSEVSRRIPSRRNNFQSDGNNQKLCNAPHLQRQGGDCEADAPVAPRPKPKPTGQIVVYVSF